MLFRSSADFRSGAAHRCGTGRFPPRSISASTFEKHAGTTCNGVMLHVTDAASFRPVTTYLTLIALARAQAPEAFALRKTPYEFETTIPAFDLLTGSSAAREALENGASPHDIVDLVAPVPAEWREQVSLAEARVLDRASA